MQEGADAYRRKDYAGATGEWQALPGADAAYNRGNALARAGRYEDAIKAYDQALAQQPDMADAMANRRLVEAAKRQESRRGDEKQRQHGVREPCKQEGRRKSREASND